LLEALNKEVIEASNGGIVEALNERRLRTQQRQCRPRFWGILGNKEPDLLSNLSARELDMPQVVLTRKGKRKAVAILGTEEVSSGPRKLQMRAPAQEAGELDLGPRKLRKRALK
jgi:hypothetical protein